MNIDTNIIEWENTILMYLIIIYRFIIHLLSKIFKLLWFLIFRFVINTQIIPVIVCEEKLEKASS